MDNEQMNLAVLQSVPAVVYAMQATPVGIVHTQSPGQDIQLMHLRITDPDDQEGPEHTTPTHYQLLLSTPHEKQ
eukprot:524242-Pelagomonas_calceolata.AAC.5